MANTLNQQQVLSYYYNLQVQAQTLMSALTQVETLLEGISISNMVIKELQNSETDHEIILPIGSYSYIKAKIPEPQNILVSYGRKTLVERDTKHALDYIRKQQEELQKQRDTLKKQVDEISIQVKETEDLLNQFQQQYQQQGLNPQNSNS
jgi:prefoldin alpha subunit